MIFNQRWHYKIMIILIKKLLVIEIFAAIGKYGYCTIIFNINAIKPSYTLRIEAESCNKINKIGYCLLYLYCLYIILFNCVEMILMVCKM